MEVELPKRSTTKPLVGALTEIFDLMLLNLCARANTPIFFLSLGEKRQSRMDAVVGSQLDHNQDCLTQLSWDSQHSMRGPNNAPPHCLPMFAHGVSRPHAFAQSSQERAGGRSRAANACVCRASSARIHIAPLQHLHDVPLCRCRLVEMATVSLADLPAEVLSMIGERVATPDRDPVDVAADAAACAMSAKALAPLAQRAWARCERIAEAGPTVWAYRARWGAITTSRLRKRDVERLACNCGAGELDTVGQMVSRIHAVSEQRVGPTCAVSFAAAQFLLTLAVTGIPVSPPPCALRDRDLTQCRARGQGRGRSVLLRCARHAPPIPPELDVLRRERELRELDHAFAQHGFRRQFREDDLPARVRYAEACAFCDRQAMPEPLRGSVIARAQAGIPEAREAHARAAHAFSKLGVQLPLVSAFVSDPEGLPMRLMLLHAMEARHGHPLFISDGSPLPNLHQDSISSADAFLAGLAAKMRNVQQVLPRLPPSVQDTFTTSLRIAPLYAHAVDALDRALASDALAPN